MSNVSRRSLLISGLAASAAAALPALDAQTVAPVTVPVKRQPTGPVAPLTVVPVTRQRLLMDPGWKFALGNANDPALDFNYGKLTRERTFAKAGAISMATGKFDDSKWATVDLPHDWAVELPFISTKPAPEFGAFPLGREFPATSIGWYRKQFMLTEEDKHARIQIQFDGIYRDAAVFLNGHYLETNFSGYAPFTLDITDWVNYGEANVLAVRVDATLGDGWFYEGAGIYRHAWLIKTALVHLVEWGTFVRPVVAGGKAVVGLGSEVRNESADPQTVSVSWQLISPAGVAVGMAHSEAVTLAPFAMHLFEAQATVGNASLWSLETRNLYRAVASVQAGSKTLDSETTTFGIRTLGFDPDDGFSLNGVATKIKGTCCHQDHAGVGAAVPDRLQTYRIERLLAMGSNGLRTSHNPPAPELMDACDRLGMMVLCETRMMDSSPEGLSQVERMVRRFRNHPSIIMWSLGNEEPEQGNSRGQRIVGTMQQLAHRLDPTRLCTVAMNNQQGTGISYVVDVQGFNYSEPRIDGVHKAFAKKPIFGTETASSLATRGIYANDAVAGYMSAYDLNAPKWGSTAEAWWKFYDERKFLCGGFAWTGFDYRGEPTPYSWPCVSSHFGIMDSCGFAKDSYFYYKAWWGSAPVLHLFPHWDWPGKNGKEISVWAFTNLESAELFQDGKSLGVQKVPHNGHVAWKVNYEPGVIEVRGSKGGAVTLKTKRETTGAASKIVLTPHSLGLMADGEDMAILTVEVQDASGRTLPTADHEIAFTVSGPARLIGLGNGDPSSHEADKASHRHLFNGLMQALVQSTRTAGAVTVTASGAGLASATYSVTTQSAAGRATI